MGIKYSSIEEEIRNNPFYVTTPYYAAYQNDTSTEIIGVPYVEEDENGLKASQIPVRVGLTLFRISEISELDIPLELVDKTDIKYMVYLIEEYLNKYENNDRGRQINNFEENRVDYVDKFNKLLDVILELNDEYAIVDANEIKRLKNKMHYNIGFIGIPEPTVETIYDRRGKRKSLESKPLSLNELYE